MQLSFQHDHPSHTHYKSGPAQSSVILLLLLEFSTP
jgi:hypothetical protein